ncbi:MAG TPA: hypothetical protein VJG48_02285 [Candidatus Paceibacterota bacterium]
MKYTLADASKFTIPGGTSGAIFPPHPKGEQTICYVETKGLYPESGVSVNDVCTETIYLLEGQLEITVDGKLNKIGKGELLVILPGSRYSIKGEAKALDIITPAWDSKQNHIIK